MTINSVRRDIEELDRCLGLKPAVGFETFAALHARREHTKLCMAIAGRMGLPNAVRLTTVSPSASAPDRQRFTTTALSTTDASGHGTHGIIAQVALPANLPMYGTAAFGAHVIDIRLRPGFDRMPLHTLVTLLAHELAHVLLHALRHPQRESEQFTDLVPLVAGFGDIVARGRVVVRTEHRRDAVHTTTVTYGYLTRGEFDAARRYVRSQLTSRRKRHLALASFAVRLDARADAATAGLQEIRQALRRLDEGQGPVSRRFARRIVELHAPGLLDGQQEVLAGISRTAKRATKFCDDLVHYSPAQVEALMALQAECGKANARLTPMERSIWADRRAVNLPMRPSDRLRVVLDWALGRLRRVLDE